MAEGCGDRSVKVEDRENEKCLQTKGKVSSKLERVVDVQRPHQLCRQQRELIHFTLCHCFEVCDTRTPTTEGALVLCRFLPP